MKPFTYFYTTSLAIALTTATLVADEMPPVLDDFNEGRDDRWTRNDTLGNAGLAPAADYTFPEGKYRISGPGAGVQWARPMAHLSDQTFEDFQVEVDVCDYSNLSQNIGLSARLSRPGFGGNLGYLLNYHPPRKRLEIWRVTADHPSGISPIAGAQVDLGDSKGFRLVFTGVGEDLTGTIAAADNPNDILETLTATDRTHQSGFVGLVTIATGSGIRTDATFDNFVAYDPKCPPAPDDTPMPELQGFKVRSEQVEMELSHLTETLHVFRSNDLEIWESITFQPNDNILTFSREKDSQGYYRLGQSLTGIKLKEQLRGRTTPSTEDECQAIQEHLPQELTEGAVIRVYSKDEGNGDHFGDYTSQFALDLFVAQVPGFEEPQPVAASGWILQTQSDGTQVFWETNLTFQLDASAHVQSRLIWGTGRFEGVTGEVSGVSVPEDPNNPLESVFLYDDSGWIRFASESETSIAE